MQSIRLPKLVESDPRGANLLQSLIEHARPIREGSDIFVPLARFDGIESELQSAHRAGRVVRGLDTAKQTLAAEERGLRLADESTGVKRGGRVSRLLLLANDGSDGFYRQVENLLSATIPACSPSGSMSMPPFWAPLCSARKARRAWS